METSETSVQGGTAVLRQRAADAQSDRNRQPAADVLDALARLPDGLVLMNRNWQITYANRRGREISRLGDEQLNGPTHWELFPATLGSDVESAYRRVLERGTTEELEFYYEPFEIWLKVRAFPVPSGLAVHYADVTGRRQAELARDKAQRRLEQVFAATADAVFSVDREWTITYMNDAARQMTAPAGDVAGRNVWQAFPDQVFPGSPYQRVYGRAMEEREPGSFEAYYPEPLNMWVKVNAWPAEDGIVVFARDVTQEHGDAEALRESEEKYRLLAEMGPSSTWVAEADGRLTYVNPRVLDYVGDRFKLPLEGDGPYWIEAYAEEDRERVTAAWVHSMETGEPFEVEARLIRHSDGALRWWRMRALPLRDEAGQVRSWLGISEEIHDQRRAKERLQREREEVERQRRELEAIYDGAPVGLALFDPEEFRYRRVNRLLAETLGVPVEELLGRRVDEVVQDPDVLTRFRRVVAGEVIRDQNFTLEIAGRPGELRTFHVNYSPVRDAAGNVWAVSTAVLDVTRQQKSEAALRQSEKLAAVGRLASSISHEINNPLEAVTNLLFLTQNEPGLSEAATEYVRMAQDEVRRVSQIATQTLRFHRQQNSPVEVTPAQLVDPVLNLFQGRLVNSRIHVEAGYATTRTVLCFEGDIRQVLNNLIGNAIDAMRNGGRLLVRAHDAHDLRSGAAGVRITVADTGHGMNAATLRRIFEPFYTTKDLNGNGLGLWISQSIVERHQGQLRVRSTDTGPLHGTVFSLFLPSGAEPEPAS